MAGMKVDEDTSKEVNCLIFDYIICLAIHTAISVAEGSTGEWDMSWLEDTVTALRLVLPPTEELPVALQIKAQVFEIARMFSKTSQPVQTMLAEMASTFVSTCKSAGEKALELHATQAASQIRNNQKSATVIYTLGQIMQLLAPPVLLQLERGNLEGMSRAETQRLKQRIGME
ncbi:uncharacterized protein DSM5745_03851 [Aspergillus mulundensis]|uniref:Uncharacterized protein n=1 Tax=Aspergillus mulundensis TaxID=1810919 RepID=A0A3D8SLJ1_9EURO|nr:Uncharacterized protein DSM5745_03851 [Aspergillus mulundensis]RDW87209.1 Uncharacterized protein DSM5745_03851 [Aspergillus mulundensis]